MDSKIPLITVGVPVFRGWQYVEESLRALQAQTFSAFQVLISVDGNDQRSAVVCRPFIADPRFRITLQEHRLGWAGNVNWLLQRCDTEFFCFAQQDDLLDPCYFEVLLEAAAKHPDAAVLYSEMVVFGRLDEHRLAPSITGDARVRMIAQIDSLLFEPFRGLVRKRALSEAGPCPRGRQRKFRRGCYLGREARPGRRDSRRPPTTLF